MQYSDADLALRQEMEDEKAAKELEGKRLAYRTAVDQIRDLGDGNIVKFTKAFAHGGMAYQYAAINVNNTWYTTGPKGSAYTPEEFALWLISGPEVATKLVVMFE
jgi:hypothetical protein